MVHSRTDQITDILFALSFQRSRKLKEKVKVPRHFVFIIHYGYSSLHILSLGKRIKIQTRLFELSFIIVMFSEAVRVDGVII